MEASETSYSASSLCKLLSNEPGQINRLTDDDVEYLLADWSLWARASQKPPPGDWGIWLFLGGRGAGKTRAGAEWVAEQIRAGHARRVALIAATHSDARSVMVEGPAGLLSVSEGAEYEPSLRRVRWPAHGAEAAVMSADDPDSFRGYQFEIGWGDGDRAPARRS
jgi:phage terminase large subunit-like protein